MPHYDFFFFFLSLLLPFGVVQTYETCAARETVTNANVSTREESENKHCLCFVSVASNNIRTLLPGFSSICPDVPCPGLP